MPRIPKRLLAPVLVFALMTLSTTALAQVDPTTTTTTAPTTTTTTTTTTAPAPSPITAVVPLLGLPLTIEVTFDADGILQAVSIDPAAGFAPIPSGDSNDDTSDEVKFVFSNGEVEIKIESEDGKLETKVKAATLDSLLGPGTWSADVFGTGAAFISYTVTGGETILIDGVTVPDGVTYEISDPKFETGDDGQTEASVRVRFFLDGVERTFKIKVEFEADQDGSTEAKLKLTLSDFEDDSNDDSDVDSNDDSDDHSDDHSNNDSDDHSDDDSNDDSDDHSDDHSNDDSDDHSDDHSDDDNSDDEDDDNNSGNDN